MLQSCISEAQKYQGALYKEKKSKADQRKTQAPVPPSTASKSKPYAAYVEDAADSPNTSQANIVAVAEVPPPAPSPPPSNVNVFDFLVTDTPTATDSANTQDSKTRNHLGADDYSYGSGPLPTSRNGSEKKRKRRDLDTPAADSRSALHTGLTGGLDRLLQVPDSQMMDASPLSPKKRSKHGGKAGDDEEDGSQEPATKRHDRKSQKAIEGSKELIPAPKSGPLTKGRQEAEGSRSELFLTLVDKPSSSSKGQSIWGTLKTFHELRASGNREAEEKKLFSGLRMKQGKNGEIILFARKDKEADDS